MLLLALLFFARSEANFNFWQGYEYTWLRRIAGFETAHRFGAFDSHIENDSAFVKVSPGVNGDYTFPSVFYRSLNLPQASFKVHVNMTDTLVNNTAEIKTNFTVPLPQRALGNTRVAPFLQGFEIDMLCIETEGEKCNSNGIWPFVIDIGWDHCDGVSSCFGSLRIGRTWTPWHGGGKSLNKRMNYYITIYGILPLIVQKVPTLYRQELIQDTISFHGEASVKQITSAPLVGFHRLGFEFLKTGGKELLGRYMEKFQFSLVSDSTSNTTEVKMQVKGPSGSTPKSDVAVWANVGIFGEDYGAPGNSKSKQKNATICWDDFPHEGFFRCQKHGMTVQHSAQITLD